MVKLKFIIKDNSLVLRISEGKERYYKYVKLLFEHPELTARQVASYFQPIKQVAQTAPEKPKENEISTTEYIYVEKYLQEIIVREKAKQGCNFETYSKLLSKCRKIIKNFSTQTFQSLDYKA